MREYGMPPAGRRGELNPNAKLSNHDARRMRELRAREKASVADLMRLFGNVSKTTVSHVLRGLTYKDAGGPVEEKLLHIRSRRRPPIEVRM